MSGLINMSTGRILVSTMAIVVFLLTFVSAISFFDSMTVGRGVLLFLSWITTIGLCFLADRCSQNESGR